MDCLIRKVQQGDEFDLAYIQTESWKAAFKDILSAEILQMSTNLNRATAMYKRLLDENVGNGYILETRFNFSMCEKAKRLIEFSCSNVVRKHPEHNLIIASSSHVAHDSAHHLSSEALSPVVLQAMDADEFRVIRHIIISRRIPPCNTMRMRVHLHSRG